MRTLILLISIFYASSLTAGVNCESSDEPDHYRERISQLGESPLCGLSPEYSAAFRLVVIPSCDEPKVVTIYHRHDRTLDLNGEYSISTDDFVRVVSEFKALKLFELDSYESLVEKYCDFRKDPFAHYDSHHSELSRCPIGFDGADVFLEAAYGGKKRIVLRWNGLRNEAYVEQQFSRVANLLLSIAGFHELTSDYGCSSSY
ncbi:hypothetical protein GL2_01450 [Microbulbifer sp. GL-2]|nr:hypothetical protein GL2_01450 [Microbulbifer sp. GL-2]